MSGAEPVVWYTRCPIPTASSVAIVRGLLDEEFAPDVAVRSLSAAPDADHGSHFDHSLARSFRDGGNVPAIWARARGAETAVVGMTWVAQFDALVALPESGIRTTADLAGQRIGLPDRRNDEIDFTRASAWATIDRALDWSGLSREQVEIVDLEVQERYLGEVDRTPGGQLFPASTLWRMHAAEVFALIRGEVDVIYLRGTHGAQLRALLGAVELSGPPSWAEDHAGTNNSTPATLTVSRDLLDTQPELVDRYVATLLRAARWARAHPRDAQALLADEVGAPRAWFERAFAPDLLGGLAPRLDDELVAALVRQKDLLRRHGIVADDVDVSTWIDRGPLRRATLLVGGEA